jgi:hypothetical protein
MACTDLHTLKLWPMLLYALLALALTTPAYAECQLNSPSGKLKHIVYIEFDNVHYTRDNPNVPSDLEQMPNLLKFITNNGTLNAGDKTVLISHTANDILTTETGLYSDDHGIFVANNFGVFGPGSGVASVYFPSSFFYWTDKVLDITPATNDSTFALTTPSGNNVPAPWVPFTRKGCDVGAFSTANIALERSPFDVQKVFGKDSPQAGEDSDHQNADSLVKRFTVQPVVLFAVPPTGRKTIFCPVSQADTVASRPCSAPSTLTRPSAHLSKTSTAMC